MNTNIKLKKANAYRFTQEKLRNKALSKGVNLIAPESIYLSKDTIFGKNVTIGHLVMLHGCTIDDNSLIGIGAVVLNNAKIGKNCIIGSKALITENKEIPDNSLVIGSPGKVVREITEEEKKAIIENTKHYQDNWKKYSKSIF